MATILQSPFFVNAVLPFVLLFTIIFAVLQKTKVLGDGKRQIDSLVALVVALIVISFANAVNVINSLLPFLAISIVVILIFMILYGMWFHGDEKGFQISKSIQSFGGALVAIAVVIAVLVVTGGWDYILDLFFASEGGSELFANLVFIGVIGVAVAIVWNSAKPSGGSSN